MNAFLRSSRAAISTAIALALSSALPAQDSPPDMPRFGERVEVNLVEILVRVTDRDGRPVRGLQREDFQVSEDGEPVEITNFLAVEDRRVVVDRLAPRDETAAPVEEARPAPAPAAVADAGPLYLAIFIDNSTLQHRNRKKALAGVQKFIDDQLGPTDRAMVAVINDARDEGHQTVRPMVMKYLKGKL